MQNIENELKNINKMEIETPNKEFKANLKKRLLNEYQIELDSQKESKTSLVNNIVKSSQSVLNNIIRVLKYQSALNLSMIFLLVSTFTVLASYMALPNNLKENLIKNKAAVNIDSSIEGAKVYVNGNLIGETPLQNYKLPEGNYTIRVEKDGYVVFSESVEVDKEEENTIVAELKRDLNSQEAYASWLDYNNSDLNFNFKYPSDWVISEELGNEANQDFKIKLSKDENVIALVFNPSNDEFLLNKNADINSYKRVLKLDAQSETSRYLQFDSEGKFVNGGLKIDATEEHPAVLVIYDFLGYEEDILQSNVLVAMDRVTQSLAVGDSGYIIAFDEDNESDNQKIDLAEIKVEDEPVATTTSAPTTTIAKETVLSQTYINPVYGYQISYPKNWEAAVTRASYPLSENGYELEINGKDTEIARLRLKGGEARARLYILTTNKEVGILDTHSDVCLSYSNSQVVKSFGPYNVVNSNGKGFYDYQICSGNNGTFVYNSEINGQIKYSIYWDVDEDEISSLALNELGSVVNSLKFNEGLIKQNINEITRTFKDDVLGISINYPYEWSSRGNSFECWTVDGSVVSYSATDIRNLNKIAGIRISSSFDPLLGNLIETGRKTIATKSGNLEFIEYSEEVCNENDECTNNFKFGVYDNGKVAVQYLSSPESTAGMMSVIGSVEIR